MIEMDGATEEDFRMLSLAIRRWYEFYAESPTDASTTVLCEFAITLFKDGCRSEDEIAAGLIGAYVGIDATRVNAPASVAVH